MKRLSSLNVAWALAAGWTLGIAPGSHAAPPAKAANNAGLIAPAPQVLKPADLPEPKGPPIKAVLTDPPMVPPPTGRKEPAHVIVELEVIEKVMRMADGVDYTFWTFGGKVPGKFIRVRQGDQVEFHLKNHPSSKMPHNIDLHAVTGPGGGAASSFTAPGHDSQFSFKTLNPGLYIYHCAVAPVGMHIANGMYGLIYVEPLEPLPPVDREFYVVQGEFYTKGKHREKGLQPFDMEKAIEENATYVLFNGAEGSLTGDNALKAKVGEKVRIFVGNGGPNLISSFHLIGEIFDRVYLEGGSRYTENLQTTIVPAGGSAIVEFSFDVPGTYVLVDHAIFRAFNKGALGMIKVEGPDNKRIYSGKQADTVYLVDKSRASGAGDSASNIKLTFAEQMSQGEKQYENQCAVCHQSGGEGTEGLFPPLAKADYLMANKARSIEAIIRGLSGPITVNGADYNEAMPPMSELRDDEIANILTYVRNSWGNKGEAVTPAEVAKVRSSPPTLAGGAAH